LLLLSVAAALVWIYVKSTSAVMRIDGQVVTLDAAFYGRTVPLASIKLREVRTVRLGEGMPLAPKSRTNGVGLPGFRLGWFRLANGERALLAVNGSGQAVYLPTSEGYSILVTLKRPVAFIEALRTSMLGRPTGVSR
jgi:hypothetical protein